MFRSVPPQPCFRLSSTPFFFGLILLISSQIIAPAGWGQPTVDSPGPSPLLEQVQQWVRQLNDRELARRQEAERQLLGLGPDVLGILPASTPATSAEVRQRLARIRNELEVAVASQVTQGSVVDLSGELPVSEIFEALERQTVNQVIGVTQPSRQVTINFSQTPYWKALDQLLDQLTLTVDPYGGRPNAIVLTSRSPLERNRLGAAVYHGAFRIEATRITATRDLRNPELQGLRVGMSVGWEPRIAPILFLHAAPKSSAEDEKGNPIDAGTARTVREIPVHTGMAAVEFEVPLALAQPGATQLARLQGELEVLVPGRVETFEFGQNLAQARGVEERRAGVVVILDDVRRNVDLYQVRLRIRFDEASGALESHRGWIFNNEAYLLDAAGNRIANAGLETTRQDQNEVGVAYLFDVPDGLDNCTFIYKTPALLIRHAIPYELKDLPLP